MKDGDSAERSNMACSPTVCVPIAELRLYTVEALNMTSVQCDSHMAVYMIFPAHYVTTDEAKQAEARCIQPQARPRAPTRLLTMVCIVLEELLHSTPHSRYVLPLFS